MVRFARNKLCALVRPGLAVDSRHLLERMLEKDVKVGTSTPRADPSGDYAFEVFRKAEAIRQGRRLNWKRKPFSSRAAQPACRRQQAARSMAGMFRKAAPISF